jgi:hypothetical protein
MAGRAVGEENRRDVLTECDRALRPWNRDLLLNGNDENGRENQNRKSLTHDWKLRHTV